MAASKGRTFVLKVGDGATSEVFTTIGGMRSNTWTLNGEQVDITDKDSDGWRELLENAGVRSVSMPASGVFKDTASEDTLRANAFNQTVDNYQLVDGDTGDTIEGPFQVASYERAGEHNGEVTFSVTLESAGEVTFTAA